jgi:hypothetical protein
VKPAKTGLDAMQAFKITDFHREHPNEPFPGYSTLDPGACERLRSQVAAHLGLPTTTGSLTLVQRLFTMSRVLAGADAQADEFDLTAALGAVHVVPQEHVYIDWHRFDAIDRMAFADLARCFDDIWYPSSDDITLFDDTFSWVVFVHHEGTLRWVLLKGPTRGAT